MRAALLEFVHNGQAKEGRAIDVTGRKSGLGGGAEDEGDTVVGAERPDSGETGLQELGGQELRLIQDDDGIHQIV